MDHLGVHALTTPFRRAGIQGGHVFVETTRGKFYRLPGNYDPKVILSRVTASRQIDLSRWEPTEQP